MARRPRRRRVHQSRTQLRDASGRFSRSPLVSSSSRGHSTPTTRGQCTPASHGYSTPTTRGHSTSCGRSSTMGTRCWTSTATRGAVVPPATSVPSSSSRRRLVRSSTIDCNEHINPTIPDLTPSGRAVRADRNNKGKGLAPSSAGNANPPVKSMDCNVGSKKKKKEHKLCTEVSRKEHGILCEFELEKVKGKVFFTEDSEDEGDVEILSSSQIKAMVEELRLALKHKCIASMKKKGVKL